MITGSYNDDTLSALLFILGHRHHFEVCGSRFYGDAHDSSDFDFVTQSDSFVSLLNYGWRKSDSDNGGYLDRNTAHVLQRGRVQIIIVKDLDLRRKAGQYIIERGWNRHESENWERAYEGLNPTGPELELP